MIPPPPASSCKCFALDESSWNQAEKRFREMQLSASLLQAGRPQKGMSVMSSWQPTVQHICPMTTENTYVNDMDDIELDRYPPCSRGTSAQVPIKSQLPGNARATWSVLWVLRLKLSCLCTFYDCWVDKGVTSLGPTHKKCWEHCPGLKTTVLTPSRVRQKPDNQYQFGLNAL